MPTIFTDYFFLCILVTVELTDSCVRFEQLWDCVRYRQQTGTLQSRGCGVLLPPFAQAIGDFFTCDYTLVLQSSAVGTTGNVVNPSVDLFCNTHLAHAL